MLRLIKKALKIGEVSKLPGRDPSTNVSRHHYFNIRQLVLPFLTVIVVLGLVISGFNVQVMSKPGNGKGKPQPFTGFPTLRIGFGTGVYAAPNLDYTITGNADDEFQAALNALPSTGGRIEAMSGTYTFAATVSRAIDNVIIQGQGASTIFNYNASTALFSAGSQSGWSFRDFKTDAGGVTVTSATNYRIENITIGSSYYAASNKTSNYVVAASNASVGMKSQADYVCDGTADDVQIQAAINALPASGGIVQLTGGTFNISASIAIGNGATSASTVNSIRLIGSGSGACEDESLAEPTNTLLFWTGAVGGTFIDLNGAIFSSEISHILIDCDSKANIGMDLLHPIRCKFEDLVIEHYKTYGIKLYSTVGYQSGIYLGAALNQFTNVSCMSPGTSTAHALYMTGSTTSAVGCCRNIFIGGDYIRGNDATAKSIWLAYTDNNLFMGIFTDNTDYANQTGYGVYLDNTIDSEWPCFNTFIGSNLAGQVEGTSGTYGNAFISCMDEHSATGRLDAVDNSALLTLPSAVMSNVTVPTAFLSTTGTSTLSTSSTEYLHISGDTIQTTASAATAYLPTITRFRTLGVYLDAAPGGAGKTRTFTLYINGSPSSLTVTYSNAEYGYKSAWAAVEYQSGESIYLVCEVANTPNASTAKIVVD